MGVQKKERTVGYAGPQNLPGVGGARIKRERVACTGSINIWKFQTLLQESPCLPMTMSIFNF